MVTLPSVRIRSGSISTATSSASGSTGTPMAWAIGPIETTKLIDPGRLTADRLMRLATRMPARPIAHAMGVPVEPLALLVAVEMLPDLMRTLGNVTMNVAVASAVDRTART